VEKRNFKSRKEGEGNPAAPGGREKKSRRDERCAGQGKREEKGQEEKKRTIFLRRKKGNVLNKRKKSFSYPFPKRGEEGSKKVAVRILEKKKRGPSTWKKKKVVKIFLEKEERKFL